MGFHIKIAGHLLIPFGCTLWKGENIKLTGVSYEALCFESDFPCVHIHRSSQKPLRLNNIGDVFPEIVECLLLIDSPREALYYIKDFLKNKCFLQDQHQSKFLDLYFERIHTQVTPDRKHAKATLEELPIPLNRYEWCFYALMPLPQAHIGAEVANPENGIDNRTKMLKVDFAFWTGKRLVAIDIVPQNQSFKSREDYIKERLLNRAGIKLISIPEEKIMAGRAEELAGLLPRDIDVFWNGLTMDDFFPSPVKFAIKLF